MSNTNWDSPHGMGNRENLTTVSDLFKLCEKALEIKLLRTIMAKKVYSCNAMKEDREGNVETSSNVYTWINTTRLLGIDGIMGMKPGWTPAAGHCLAISYEKDGHTFVIITV